MTERLIFDDYELRGSAFEVWVDGSYGAGGYPSWWLATEDPAIAAKFNLPLRTVLTGDEFDPPLSEREMTDIGEAVLGFFSS